VPVSFATPVAHQTDADYTAFNNAIGLGRPFRQPYTAALATNPNNYARGLELFLAAAGDGARLYAWLDGSVTFVAATSAAPGERLVLATSPTVTGAGTNSMNRLPMLERPPKRLTFENVDRAAVQTALETLLTEAHIAATGPAATWHPSMRLMVTAGTAAPVTLKTYLDGHAPVAATVTTLVTDLLTPPATGTPLLTQVPVKAGDVVGRAAAYLATDPLPTPEPFPLGAVADSARARRVTIVVEDSGDNQLDPLYFLYVFMRRMLVTPTANRIVVTLTNIVVGANLVHPLVTLLPALNAATVPTARTQVAGAYRYRIGDLGNWHGYPFPPVTRVSLGEWRYTAAGVFEARVASTSAAIATAATPAHTTKVTSYWTAHAAITNTICTRLQVPVELVTALACNESLPDLSPRSIRLEPLLTANRTKVRASAHAALELSYDKVVGTEVTVTGVTRQANEQSLLRVTLGSPRAITANRFASKKLRLLVGDAHRLEITANTAGAATATAYDITVKDHLVSGGGTPAGTQPPATTWYYSIAARVAANAAAAPVETVLTRDGVLRRLRFRAGINTLPAGTVVTVLQNGAATTLTATLGGTPTQTADDLVNEVTVASGDRIVVRVATPAGAATALLRNVTCTLQFAPAGAGTAYVLEGYSPPSPGVPNPWNGAALVRAGRTLTWDQLSNVMDALGGARVSPGLLQTLISTAVALMRYLNELDPGIYAAVGVTPAPANAGGYLQWLCTPAHSILLGAAYMRELYRKKDTRLDLPVVGAAYNRGNVSTTPNRPWGFGDPTWVYPDHIAPYFNAAVGYFDGATPPAVAPTVRFLS
jgi:hypothetical protein